MDSRYTLVQYLFKYKIPLPHGNSKKGSSYRRMFQSARKALQASAGSKEENPKEALDNVCQSVGDVAAARSHGELPRGPRDVYNARFAAKKAMEMEPSSEKNSKRESRDVTEVRGIWQLLETAKREEEEGSESVFIRECRIHPDFLIILASDRQLQDLKQRP